MKRCLVLVLFCLANFTVHAEDCTAAKYPLSGQEKAFFSSFVKLRAALPKPPAGWRFDEESQSKLGPDYQYLPASECDISNYTVGIEVGYERPTSQAELQAEVQAERGPPDPATKKKLDDLMAQQQALAQKMAAAAQKQDTLTLDALGKQNDALTKQITAVQKGVNAGSQAKLDALRRDRRAKASFGLNDQSDFTCYGSPKPLQVAGAAYAYECSAPASFDSEGNQVDPARAEVVVVFGKYKLEQYDWDRTDASGKTVHDKYIDIKPDWDDTLTLDIQNLTAVFEGDDAARVESLYQAADIKSLAALIKH